MSSNGEEFGDWAIGSKRRGFEEEVEDISRGD